jgi:hypothetical protein
MPRPAAPFQLTADQQVELRARLRQATMAPRLRVRLQILPKRAAATPAEIERLRALLDHHLQRVTR